MMQTKGILTVIVILAGAGLFAVITQAQELKTVWLDTMDINNMTAGWGSTEANKSVGGNPLKINEQAFSRGIGTHANSEYELLLDGRAKRLTAFVGIDQEVGDNPQASVEFIVIGDGKELYNSGIMKASTPAKSVDVNLAGIKKLKLLVTDAGDTNARDHADLAMAKIEYIGQKPQPMKPVTLELYILTPKPKAEPRITGPKVFGVRPGNPFLFTVTATGKRPMTFYVKGLPQGLSLDAASGQITGTVEKKGTYKTTVIAENSAGRAERAFRIVSGDTICLTPPMGWNSWNCWACSVDDEKVRATARAMVETGLINHGWSYINIDDCWMRKPDSNNPIYGEPVRDKEGFILANEKFPDMKYLTDYIHRLGLKAGLYISPGPTTCQGYEGSWQHEMLDAQRFADWGFDYLKYDWCGYNKVAPKPTLEQMKEPYILMRQKLDMVSRDIIYSLCQYGMGNVWEWGKQVGGNCWRTTDDIIDNWSSMSGIGFKQADLYAYAVSGHWNDPDMLVVGKVGWGAKLHNSHLTPDEQYTHISLWCLLSAPLLIGCPIEQIDDFTMNLLTNDEVLDVDQDPMGHQAKRIVKSGDVQIFAKEIEDGTKAVGLFNLSNTNQQKITLKWKDMAIEGSYRVRDLWRQKDLGVFEDSFTAEVPSHGVVLIRLFKEHS